jgi:sterol desaturase/sphingolipid hydroxylase (fatty acid hydroxylase superfamily)
LESFVAYLAAGAVFAAAIAIGRIIERRRPIENNHPRPEIVLDYKLVAANLGFAWLFSPLTSACAVAMTHSTGAALIPLRTDGFWFLPALLAYMLTLDFLLYLQHRAQHAIPVLWAMHELHHSAEAITVSTGARHFWLEGVLKSAFLVPVAGMLVGATPGIALTSGLIYLIVDSCAHMNCRLPLGRSSLVVNNPQFHRIHHSVLPEHGNRNFSDLLPIWDVIFGTVWKPGPDEWPSTGLASRHRPGTVIDGIVWPFRRSPAVRWSIR